MNKFYKALKKQFFEVDGHMLVPIRDKDKYLIMKWRNEQLYHLRQTEPLIKANQDHYFKNILNKHFEEEYPSQILFSYLFDKKCIGYGGLVHINWTDKNAELSFIMNTDLEKNHFKLHWSIFLKLIEKIAFEELNFKKIYTYAFDIRPKLYEILESCYFKQEARLRNHKFINGNYADIVIHSKINDKSAI